MQPDKNVYIVTCQGSGVSSENHLPQTDACAKTLMGKINLIQSQKLFLTTEAHTWGGPGTPKYIPNQLFVFKVH